QIYQDGVQAAEDGVVDALPGHSRHNFRHNPRQEHQTCDDIPKGDLAIEEQCNGNAHDQLDAHRPDRKLDRVENSVAEVGVAPQPNVVVQANPDIDPLYYRTRGKAN